MLRWLTRWSIGASLVVVLVGCATKDPLNPGTTVGTFHVEAKLTSLSCGGTAPDPWAFDVKVSHDGDTVYWIQGGTPISGTVDADGHTAFSAQTVSDVRDGTTKQAGCSLARTDNLGVYLLDATTKPTTDPTTLTSFSGQLSYAYAPTDGSDCGDQLTSAGGSWQALPCAVTYDVTGTLKQ